MCEASLEKRKFTRYRTLRHFTFLHSRRIQRSNMTVIGFFSRKRSRDGKHSGGMISEL